MMLLSKVTINWNEVKRLLANASLSETCYPRANGWFSLKAKDFEDSGSLSISIFGGQI